MNAELEQKLADEYPELFADKNQPPTKSLMCYGCDHGDGWFDLIWNMCKLIQKHVKSNWKGQEPYKFSQIKEKFAGLRVYDNGRDPYIRGVIDMAESMSYKTCEICGLAGQLNYLGIWMKTLCKKHAEELGHSRKTEQP